MHNVDNDTIHVLGFERLEVCTIGTTKITIQLRYRYIKLVFLIQFQLIKTVKTSKYLYIFFL